MFIKRMSRIDRLVVKGKDEALIRLAVKHKQAVRLKALEGMARLGGERCFERAAACLNDPDPTVRCAAARALYQMDGGKCRPAIEKQLRSEADPQVRHALREALEKNDGILRGNP